MKLYLTTISVAMTVIAAINVFFETASVPYIIFAVIGCTVLQIALDGAMAILIRLTPDHWYGADDPRFDISNKEKKLYNKLKVRLWKDRVLELGGLGGFSKKHLTNPDDPAYIEKFIIECNKGVVTHRLSYPIGFLGMLLMPNICAFTIALPIAIVNLYLNILPTLVLRYNTPLLKSVLKRLHKKSMQNIQ